MRGSEVWLAAGTVRVRICVSCITVVALTAGIRFMFFQHLMGTVNATANSSLFLIFKHMILPLLAKWCGVQKIYTFQNLSHAKRFFVSVRLYSDNKLMAIEQH